MNRLNSLGRVGSWVAAALMIAAPGVTAAAETTSPMLSVPTAGHGAAQPYRVVDVALDAAGGLNGQAMSSQGQPLAQSTVTLDDGRRQWQATTGADGQFRFEGVHGGGYRICTGNQVQFCRAWKAGTAPPAANQAVMVVDGQPTVLGQYCGTPIGCGTPVCGSPVGGCKELLRNPLVIGGIIAAAIAIPVALHNADDDDPAS